MQYKVNSQCIVRHVLTFIPLLSVTILHLFLHYVLLIYLHFIVFINVLVCDRIRKLIINNKKNNNMVLL